MERIIRQIENQDGSAILIAVVTLLMLTVLGLAAIRNTGMELQIAGNSKIYQRNLYAAEGAGQEAARRIENATDTELEGLTPDWLNSHTIDITDPAAWTIGVGGDSQAAEFDNGTNVIRFAATDNGIAPGSSLVATSSTKLHAFTIYGNSIQNSGDATLESGYRKRF